MDGENCTRFKVRIKRGPGMTGARARKSYSPRPPDNKPFVADNLVRGGNRNTTHSR